MLHRDVTSALTVTKDSKDHLAYLMSLYDIAASMQVPVQSEGKNQEMDIDREGPVENVEETKTCPGAPRKRPREQSRVSQSRWLLPATEEDIQALADTDLNVEVTCPWCAKVIDLHLVLEDEII